VDPKSTHDWVWLMWLALDTASAHYRRPVACQRALRDLSYLFALDYKSSRKMTLVPVIIHAMHLVRLDTLDWSSSIYTNEQSKSMITKACTNIDVMYAEVERRRHTNLENAAKEAVNENSALSTTDDTQPVEASVTVVTKPSTQTPQKNKKGCMSEASKSKMDTMDAIDEHLFFY
jgi:glutamate synthase domain-containing protein 2